MKNNVYKKSLYAILIITCLLFVPNGSHAQNGTITLVPTDMHFELVDPALTTVADVSAMVFTGLEYRNTNDDDGSGTISAGDTAQIDGVLGISSFINTGGMQVIPPGYNFTWEMTGTYLELNDTVISVSGAITYVTTPGMGILTLYVSTDMTQQANFNTGLGFDDGTPVAQFLVQQGGGSYLIAGALDGGRDFLGLKQGGLANFFDPDITVASFDSNIDADPDNNGVGGDDPIPTAWKYPVATPEINFPWSYYVTVDGTLRFGDIPTCCIDIEKEVALDLDNPEWYDADNCSDDPLPVPAPHGAMYRLIVSNCGDVALDDVLINDATLGITNENIGTLAAQGQPGDSVTLTGLDISQLMWMEDRCVGTEEIINVADATGTCADPVGGTRSDDDAACWECEEEEPSTCRVTAGGNKDAVSIPCLSLADGKIVNPEDCATDSNGHGRTVISNTWGGQAGAQPAIDCNWTHHYKSGEGNFGFHSNDCFYIECSDPGPDCVPAADGKPETRQIDFSGKGRFTHGSGNFDNYPDRGQLCFMVHLEDIGEPGRGGKWPVSVAEGLDCEHCPGTAVVNGDPDDLSAQSDCRDCTDYYQLLIFDSYDPDPVTGNCRGSVIWANGNSIPEPQCTGGDVFVAPHAPYDDGFYTRAGNVQMHPDNNGTPVFNYEVFCDNGIDDDEDGKTDCADNADCNKDPACD